MNEITKIESDIKNLKIQGATNVALAVLDALEQNPDKEIGVRLAYARPTEPLAQNAIRYIFSDSEGSIAKKITQYRTFIDQGKRTIPENGDRLLVDGGSYLTLCHSSTTVSLIEGRKGKIDAVFIGADLLTDTGFVNKVGSLAVASAANHKNIPVYSLSTLLKYDPRPFDPSTIETRSPKEIWKKAPKNLQFYAPAFDYVPYFSNVNIICEHGILSGQEVKNAVQVRYPFLFS